MAKIKCRQEALAERRMLQLAAARLEAVRAGRDELLEADDFFAKAAAAIATRRDS